MQPKKKLSDIVRDMAALKQQWANTKPAPDSDKPVPAGEYICDLVEGTAFESRTRTPGYKVTLKVKEGEFAGRFVWHDIYLTPAALPYTMRALAKIGITDPEQLDDGLPPGLVVRAKLVVNTRDDGTQRNEVRSWELVAVNAPALAAEPTPWSVDVNATEGQA